MQGSPADLASPTKVAACMKVRMWRRSASDARSAGRKEGVTDAAGMRERMRVCAVAALYWVRGGGPLHGHDGARTVETDERVGVGNLLAALAPRAC